MGLFSRFKSDNDKEKLDGGLRKTRDSFFEKLGKAIAGKSKVDAEVLDELEETLVAADVGLKTTLRIIENIEARVARDKYLGISELKNILRQEVSASMLSDSEHAIYDFNLKDVPKPFVFLIVGVNGVGKTTTIGKLASQFSKNNMKVVLGAADTFRAAAIEQLGVWAKRSNAHIVAKNMGADPSSVAYETLQIAIEIKADVVLIDTAGRLHNKANLMSELSKVKRVMSKLLPEAPHEVLLVLDASTGQNAMEQARQFSEATDVTALALTKLDGTAKGGVVIGISAELGIPVRFIGLGEGIEDLQLFDRDAFVASLFGDLK